MIRWFFQKLRNFFSTEVSTEVPAELAACEFDCREAECLTEDFLTCPRRLQKAEALKKLELSEEDLALHKRETN